MIYALIAVVISSCEQRETSDSAGLQGDPSEVFLKSHPKELPPGWAENGFCVGIARNALSDPKGLITRPSVVIGDVAYCFKGDFQWFPKEILGQRIKVTGEMTVGHLPMFIRDPAELNKNRPRLWRSGMPMPPGTDLEKESRFYFIKDAHWLVLD